MMAILTLTANILPAVASLALTNVQLQEANVAFERMYEYAHLTPEQPMPDTSVVSNLCLGDTINEAASIVSFCQEYGFDRYFERFPQGYLTLLGEEGVNLSGGQRQLVALARALYQKPQLLLLDEPTAAMDRHTEGFVMKLIERLRLSAGVLLITHKARYTRSADRVYRLENHTLRLINQLNWLNENRAALEPILK